MAKEKPLTLSKLIKYNQEVLIPVFENRMNGIEKKIDKIVKEISNTVTKDQFNSLKKESQNFKNETLTGFDKVLKKLDILIEEKISETRKTSEKENFTG